MVQGFFSFGKLNNNTTPMLPTHKQMAIGYPLLAVGYRVKIW